MKTVDPDTLRQWLDRGEAVLVDVREPAEHRSQHIRPSRLVPLRTISAATLPDLQGKKLVIHCLKGGRGAAACERLLAENPSLDVYNLSGGLEAWVQASLALEAAGRPILPLDRQVQLIIGFLVLSASALAYFVNPLFSLLSGFFGAGLVMAGVTGFCGMARLVALMPWNQRT